MTLVLTETEALGSKHETALGLLRDEQFKENESSATGLREAQMRYTSRYPRT